MATIGTLQLVRLDKNIPNTFDDMVTSPDCSVHFPDLMMSPFLDLVDSQKTAASHTATSFPTNWFFRDPENEDKGIYKHIDIVQDGALGPIWAIEDSLQPWSVEQALNILWVQCFFAHLHSNLSGNVCAQFLNTALTRSSGFHQSGIILEPDGKFNPKTILSQSPNRHRRW
jgi:hypothetical protein